jgi:glucose-1-phosphate cytidylyltransferase
MHVGILAGGLGTRLMEETTVKPKPMVEIGGQPILWHIMKIYAAHGFTEFVIALGYKSEFIKDYFINYRNRAHNLTVRLRSGAVEVHTGECEDWTIHLLDTGSNTLTGGRVKRIAQFLCKQPFMLTYGDGVADIDLKQLLACHQESGKIATVTAVHPPARFGNIELSNKLVASFAEKPQTGEGWINGGFFVLNPSIVDYIESDNTLFEREPLERLVAEEQLAAYRHPGFWQCMDTVRDVRLLESLWQSDKPPWKVWE